MKTLLSFCLCLLILTSVTAQNLVSPIPTTKRVLVEKFTGVRCPSCPPGNTTVNALKEEFPVDAWIVGYHPTRSNYSVPINPGDMPLGRAFPDSIFSDGFAQSRRYIPSAYISRRSWGTRLQPRTMWRSHALSIMEEASPVNMGIEALYDTTFQSALVSVEVFFTASTNPQSLHVLLLENDLVVPQHGDDAGPDYVHAHVFRASLTDGQWGDPIPVSPDSGSYYARQLVFNNGTAQYDGRALSVVAFLRDEVTEEITTVTGLDYIAYPGATTSVDRLDISDEIKLYPNPVKEKTTVSLTLNAASEVQIAVYNLLGQKVTTYEMGSQSAGTQKLTIDTSQLQPGTYLLQVKAGNQNGLKHFVKL